MNNKYDYEPEMCQILENMIKPGFICVDLGAHQGNITKVMAELVGESGKVFAFEASPDNSNILRDNIENLGFSNRVIVENKAVCDMTQESVWLYFGRKESSYEWNIVGHNVEGNITEKWRKVPGIALDDYFANDFHLDFFKIDVEGSADKIFSGMPRILKEIRPTLLIEFHDDNEWSGRVKLYEVGYTLHTLDGNEINPSATRHYQCIALPPK
jgi:FkbM family methyltransferase